MTDLFSDARFLKFLQDLDKARSLDLINTLDDVENALGWVVLTTEIDRIRIYGLFDEPAAAMECAAAAERFRREDTEDDDWSVSVYPLLPP